MRMNRKGYLNKGRGTSPTYVLTDEHYPQERERELFGLLLLLKCKENTSITKSDNYFWCYECYGDAFLTLVKHKKGNIILYSIFIQGQDYISYVSVKSLMQGLEDLIKNGN